MNQRTLQFRGLIALSLLAASITSAFGQAGAARNAIPSGAQAGSGPSLPAIGPQFENTGPQRVVFAVRIVGNESVPESKVRSYMKTMAGRNYNPDVVEQDVRTLVSSRLFHNAKTYTQETAQGLVVTFQVFERPTIRYIKFIGNEDLSDDTLLKKSGLKVGDALELYSIDEAVSKIEQYYHSVGYVGARVYVQEGNQPQHKGVVIVVHEGKPINVAATNFVGNTIVSGSRLKTLIKTVPGTLMIFAGKLDEKALVEDIDKLTAYYRGLGYFRARISRELEYSSSGEWVTVTFVVDEGPRYTVRNVSFIGNKIFDNEALGKDLDLKPGETYVQDKMDKDLNRIRRLYGSQGYCFSEIQAEPRFGLEPGVLDLVYNVKEGNQYRVGNVVVKIEGDYTHTRRTVALNRLSIRPGDIIDVREIEASKRRLRASQLFQDSPQMGIQPQIVVLPPDGLEMDMKRR